MGRLASSSLQAMSLLNVTGNVIFKLPTVQSGGGQKSEIIFLFLFFFFSVRKATLSTENISPQASIYVILKLQHVKSTTVPTKGPQPSWEQDFLL